MPIVETKDGKKEWQSKEYQEMQEQKQKELNVSVSVDNTAIQQTMNENDKLRAEAEDVKEVKAFFDAERQKASTELTNLGVETNFEDIKTNSDLTRANQTIQKLRESHEQPTATYDPSLAGQYQQQQKQGAYASPETMITDLMTKEQFSENKAEKAQAKEVLNQMTLKVIKGGKEGQIKGFDFPKDESVIDKINESFRKKHIIQRGSA